MVLVSSPERINQGINLWCGEIRILDGGQEIRDFDPGNRLGPAVDASTCVTKALALGIVLSPECDYVH